MKERLSVWIRRTWNRVIIGLQEFFGDKDLVTCASCNKTMFRKRALYTRTLSGLGVPLCKSCYDTEFKPFSTKSDDTVFGRGKERG